MDTFIEELLLGLERAYKDLLADLPGNTPELLGLTCEIDDGGNVDNMDACPGYMDGSDDVDDSLDAAQDILEAMVEEGIEWGDHGAYGDHDLAMDEDAHMHILTKVRIDLGGNVTATCCPRNSFQALRTYLRSIGLEEDMPPAKRKEPSTEGTPPAKRNKAEETSAI